MNDKEKRWLSGLKEVSAIIKAHGLTSFLDTGTLLGAIRDKKFIPWDSDVDISLLDTDYNSEKILEVVQAIYDAGYNVSYFYDAIYIYKDPDVAIGIMLYKSSGDSYRNHFCKTDIASRFLFVIDNVKHNRLLWCKGRRGSYWFKQLLLKIQPLLKLVPQKLLDKAIRSQNIKQIIVPTTYFEGFKDIELYGEQFSAPIQPEKYLEYRYGKDWQTPIQEYDYMTDDQSLISD